MINLKYENYKVNFFFLDCLKKNLGMPFNKTKGPKKSGEA